MYFFLIFLPLFSFLWISLAGFFLGRLGSCYLGSLGLFLSLIISFFIFFEVGLNNSIVSIKLFNWILLDIYNVEIGFLFDSVSSVMLVIITSISFFVYIYSISYMSEDPYISRFMSYLSLFTFFMIILVTADNFLQLYAGWEGVGLCSYLLINFWFTRVLANKAALKAMIMNRIADIFFMFGLVLIFLVFKTTDFVIVFNLIPFILEDSTFFLVKSYKTIDLIAFFLFVGSIGKSAQIGFHTWLPDAMEGPTPVSALLHAATMVTAGIFLIIRCSFFFEFSENTLSLIFLFGSVTTFFSGFVALFQFDIKKVIAYSTCSQLGYMFISCGLSNYSVALFHLFNHAFFKALLFLSAGYIIHAFSDEQDMRKYGGYLLKIMPFTYFCFFLGSLAIMGFPFLTGFYSKEVIIEFAQKSYIIDSGFLYIISIASASLTGFYSWRLLFFCFLNPSINAHKSTYTLFLNNKVEFKDLMFYSMLSLAICSIIFGFLFSDIMINLGTPLWGDSIYVLPAHNNLWNIENFSSFFNLLPLVVIFWTFYIIAIVLQFNGWAKVKWGNYGKLLIKHNNSPYLALSFLDISLLDKGCGLLFYKVYAYFLHKLNYSFFSRASFFFFHYLPKAGYNAFFFNKVYNYIFKGIYALLYYSVFKYIEKGIFDFLWVGGPYKAARGLTTKLGRFLFFPPVLFIALLSMFFFFCLVYLFFLFSSLITQIFFLNLGGFFLIILYVYGVNKPK